MQIPLSQIAVIDRGRKDLGDVADLIESMKENGQIQSIVVRHPSDAEISAGDVNPLETPYVLVVGGRRYKARALGGWPDIRAELFEELSPLRRKSIELEENLRRKAMTWEEEVAMKDEIQLLREQEAAERGEKRSQKATAQELGEDPGNLSRDIRLARAIKKDPSLAQAPSKKAAMRMLEMKEHMERRVLRSTTTAISAADLRDKLVCAKAEDFLATVPTASVELVCTDFPYGIDYYTGGHKMRSTHQQSENVSVSEYDDSEEVTLDLFVQVVPELIRITKRDGWIATTMCDENYDFLKECFESCCALHMTYGEVIYESLENGDWIKHMPEVCTHKEAKKGECFFLRAEMPGWIWYRPNSQNPPRYPERHVQNQYERILVINRGGGRIYRRDIGNVLVHDAEYGNRIHAMQKPMALGIDIISRLTLSGERVLDPFMGSGAFLRAAAKLNRDILGCDSNPALLDLAVANVLEDYHGGALLPTQETVDA